MKRVSLRRPAAKWRQVMDFQMIQQISPVQSPDLAPTVAICNTITHLSKEYRLQLRMPHLRNFHLVYFLITAIFALS